MYSKSWSEKGCNANTQPHQLSIQRDESYQNEASKLPNIEWIGYEHGVPG
jgi:hypothetical protein